MSEKGLCVVCGLKSERFWLSNPCKHEICQICLTKETDPEVCSGCSSKVESLSCPGKKYGCPLTAAPKSWKDHAGKCLYARVLCPYGCEAVILKMALLSHMDKDCQLRIATCKFCAQPVYHVEVASHEEACPEAPVTCPYCLLEGIKMKEFSSHADGCPKTPRPCPLEKFGCDFTGIDADMDEHLVLKTHAVCFKKLNQTLQEDQEEITRLRSEVDLRVSELDQCKTKLEECEARAAELDQCKVKLEECEADLSKHKKLLETGRRSKEGCILS